MCLKKKRNTLSEIYQIEKKQQNNKTESLELKHTLNNIKNAVKRINVRTAQTAEIIGWLKDRSFQNTHLKVKNKNQKNKEERRPFIKFGAVLKSKQLSYYGLRLRLSKGQRAYLNNNRKFLKLRKNTSSNIPKRSKLNLIQLSVSQNIL